VNFVASISNTVLDFVYPPICLSCSTLLANGSVTVCEQCWNSIRRIEAEESLFLDTHERLRASHMIDDLVSVYVFEKSGPFQHIAHAIKYQSFQSLAVSLGREIGKKMLSTQIDADTLVPVPLHRVKQRERGYNQAELIARGMAEKLPGNVLANAIRRTRYTISQTTLSIDERQKNMLDAFEIPEPDAVRGKRVALIDDVITTGATTIACAAALRSAGAESVVAISAALAHKDSGT
jgi:ComF family protein